MLRDAARLPEVEQELWKTKLQLEQIRSELEDVQSELDAFRNRLSRILVDRMVVSAKRYPGVYRVGRYVARRMVQRFRRLVPGQPQSPPCGGGVVGVDGARIAGHGHRGCLQTSGKPRRPRPSARPISAGTLQGLTRWA